MGMQHMNKLWGKGNSPSTRTNSGLSADRGNVTSGRSVRPSIPRSNMAGPTTPQYIGSGNAPLKGAGSPNNSGWAKKSQK